MGVCAGGGAAHVGAAGRVGGCDIDAVMLSAKDDELLGVSNSIDGMGVLAVWTQRARDLIPHLTAQTRSARGFQILVEALRLWEDFVPGHSQHHDRVADFFILIEQTFARIVAQRTGDWPLPGARRVRARMDDEPHISVKNTDWHLLGGQRANGLWGLYRGAAGRANLLDETLSRLQPDVLNYARQHPIVAASAQRRLFAIIDTALKDGTPAVPIDFRNPLPREIYDGFHGIPAAPLLRQHIVLADELTEGLATRLLGVDELDHRTFLRQAAPDFPDHHQALENAIRCEDLVAVLESVFFWLCGSAGRDLDTAAAELPVDLHALSAVRDGFADSGHYTGVAAERHTLFLTELDTSSHLSLINSVLRIHERISKARGRALWVWEEDGRLVGDVAIGRPDDPQLTPGVAWRNDYFLSPLRSITATLEEALQ